MGVFKENFDSKQAHMNQSMVMPGVTQNKQRNGVTAPEQSLMSNKEKESVLSLKGLEKFEADKLKTDEASKYRQVESRKDAATSERESRKRAEVNGASAAELKSLLDEIGVDVAMAKMIDKEMDSLGLGDGAGADLSEIDAEKFEILKKQAPKVYERLLKFEQLRLNLPKDNKKLKNYARQEMMQTQREWDYVRNMAGDVNGSGADNEE